MSAAAAKQLDALRKEMAGSRVNVDKCASMVSSLKVRRPRASRQTSRRNASPV
jgi:hypothetical protein